MKYYCEKCGRIFGEDELIVHEYETDGYTPPNESWYCPYCGADENDLWETEECEMCGEDIPPYELTKSSFCEYCKAELDYWKEAKITEFANEWKIPREKALEVLNEYLAEL